MAEGDLKREDLKELTYQWECGKQLVFVRMTGDNEAIVSVWYDRHIWLHTTFTRARLSEFTVGLSAFEGNQVQEYNWQADGENQLHCDISVLRRDDGEISLTMSYQNAVWMSVDFTSTEFAEFVQGLREWKIKVTLQIME